MSISIKNAISTIFSRSTNKINLVNFILLNLSILITSIIIGLFVGILSKSNNNSLLTITIITIIIGFILSLLLLPFTLGYIAKSVNNSIKCKKGIFPNPFNFGPILKIGIKCLIGCGICGFILYAIPTVPAAFLITSLLMHGNNITQAIIIGIIYFIIFGYISIFIFPTIMLRFWNSFEMKVFFQFNETIKMIKENNKIICQYVFALFKTWLLVVIVIIPIYIFIYTIFKDQQETIRQICTLIQLISGLIITIINVDLAGQAGRLLFFEENKNEIAKA